jgi:hypothetical protein
MFGNEGVWRTICFDIKWLKINADVAYKRIINFTHVVELRNTGKYLYKIRCKWEIKISNIKLETGREECNLI